MKNNPIILTGISASGKTVLQKFMVEKDGFVKVVTTTTRPMRDGEVDGESYHFLSKDEFLKKKIAGDFIETNQLPSNNEFYGTTYEALDHASAKGIPVLVLDYNGANKLKDDLPSDFKPFIVFLDCPVECAINRVKRRSSSREAEERIESIKTTERDWQFLIKSDYTAPAVDLLPDGSYQDRGASVIYSEVMSNYKKFFNKRTSSCKI